MSRRRIIGLGTAFGDDRVGLAAAERLRIDPPADWQVCVSDRPGVELLDLLAGAAAVIVVDAVRSGAPPGTLHEVALEAVSARDPGAISSHGIGVAAALALARTLGSRPRGRFIGIEIAADSTAFEAPLSSAVAAALGAAVERVRACAAELCCADDPRPAGSSPRAALLEMAEPLHRAAASAGDEHLDACAGDRVGGVKGGPACN